MTTVPSIIIMHSLRLTTILQTCALKFEGFGDFRSQYPKVSSISGKLILFQRKLWRKRDQEVDLFFLNFVHPFSKKREGERI